MLSSILIPAQRGLRGKGQESLGPVCQVATALPQSTHLVAIGARGQRRGVKRETHEGGRGGEIMTSFQNLLPLSCESTGGGPRVHPSQCPLLTF